MAEHSKPADEEPISLDDDFTTPTGPSSVKAFGGPRLQAATEFHRPVNITGAGATRLKVFYSKIAPASLQFMENQVNQWIDAEKIEVKSVGQMLGVLEGKSPAPNVIVFVWY